MHILKIEIPKILAASSVAVLVISLLGDLTSLGNNRNAEARKWERFEPSLTSRIRTLDDFGIEAEQRNPDFKQMNEKKKMTILYEVIIDRFCHGPANHNLFSNWMLLGTGIIFPQTGSMWDPNLILQKSNSVICNQISDILVQVALRNGITARSVGLNGHVIMEAWFDSGWHFFDPDLEVVPVDPTSGKILSVNEAPINKILLEKYYYGEKLGGLQSLLTSEDNLVASSGLGSSYIWKGDALRYFEKILNILKYLLPISVLFVFFIQIRLQKASLRGIILAVPKSSNYDN